MAGRLVHNIAGNVPEGFFTQENTDFLQKKIIEVLKRDYTKDIVIDKNSILRIMQRIIEGRLESIPRMNQRVVMEICSEFRQYQVDMNRKMQWESNYIESQKIYDMVGALSSRDIEIKLGYSNSGPFVGGTTRFWFPY
jgi:hypothetical protein